MAVVEHGAPVRGRVVLLTGASRGIGRAIAQRLAAEGARLVLAARSERPHPKLEGTLGETVRAVEEAGGEAFAVRTDLREDAAIDALVRATEERFGHLDALIHNAGAIHLAPLADTPLRRFDLVHQVNARAAFALASGCIPLLRRGGAGAQMLFLAPPVDLRSGWIAGRIAYTLSKYGVSLLVRGLAEELRAEGIAVRALWPRKIVATAAVRFLGGEPWLRRARRPEVLADAVAALLSDPLPLATSGSWLLDEEVLVTRGVPLERYADRPGAELLDDLYVGEPPAPGELLGAEG